jgi:DNA-binding NarL/FixJ family response regulator
VKPEAKILFQSMSLKFLNILVVEDYDQHFYDLTTFLSTTSLKYRLTRAENLSSAINICNENLFDIVLLDLVLPDSPSDLTLDRFLISCPDTPVVVLTSCKDEELGADLIKKGAQDYLPKEDISHSDLLARTIRYSIERFSQNLSIRDLNYSLDRSNNELENFAFLIKGEILETLQSLRTYCSIYYEDLATKEDLAQNKWIQQNIFVPEASLKNLDQLTEELLVYARMSIKDGLEVQECSISAVFTEVIKSYPTNIANKRQLKLGTVEILPTIWFYSHQLKRFIRSIVNLLATFNSQEATLSLESAKGREKKDFLTLKISSPIIFDDFDNKKRGTLLFRQLFSYSTAVSLSIIEASLKSFGCRLWVELGIDKGVAVFVEFPKDLRETKTLEKY